MNANDLTQAWFKTARETIEPMDLEYKQISERNWYVLNVSGVPFTDKGKAMRSTLKSLGFWWDRKNSYWTINSGTSYDAFGQSMNGDITDDGQPHPKLVEKNRKNSLRRKQQKEAWPVVQKMVAEYNQTVAEPHNKALKKLKSGFPTDPTQVHKYVDSISRREKWLSNAGITVKAVYPKRYEFFEAYVSFSGNTYHIKDVLKSFDFRWNGSGKSWVLPYVEWSVIEKAFFRAAGQTIQEMQRAQPSPPKGMSERDLALVLLKTKKKHPKTWDALMGFHYYEESGNGDIGWIRSIAKGLSGLNPAQQAKWVDMLSKGDDRGVYRELDRGFNLRRAMTSMSLEQAWFKTAGLNVPQEVEKLMAGADFDHRAQKPLLKKISATLKRSLGVIVSQRDSSFIFDKDRGLVSLNLTLLPKDALESRWDIRGSRELDWKGPKTDALVKEVAAKVSKSLGLRTPSGIGIELLPWNSFLVLNYLSHNFQ